MSRHGARHGEGYDPVPSSSATPPRTPRGDGYDDPPAAFVCPITQELMREPVVTSDGHTYERAAIQRWLRDHNTSPQTNRPLPSKQLLPNIALRKQIADFRAAHGYSPPSPWRPPPDPARAADGSGVDACPSLPGWVVAGVFLAVWLMAWAAGEVTVAKEVAEALAEGNLSFATFFTIVWLGAWSFGGCVACSAMWGLCCRECWPRSADGVDDPSIELVDVLQTEP